MENQVDNDERPAYAMYLFVNKDLNMSPGKIGAQVGHVTEMIAEEMMKSMYEDINDTNTAIWWKEYTSRGRKKVVCSATLKELDELTREVDCLGYVDEGLTEVPENSLTVVGFIPKPDNRDRFKKFRLL